MFETYGRKTFGFGTKVSCGRETESKTKKTETEKSREKKARCEEIKLA